jgi:phage terminase small subunit
MPAPKPKALNRRHDTNETKTARESAEAALTPKTALTVKPPPVLDGHKHAQTVWKRIVSLYFETDGTIVTAFDESLLADFCLVIEDYQTLVDLRSSLLTEVQRISREIDAWQKKKVKKLKDFISLSEQRNATLARYQGFDARLDGKRKLALSMMQSLYLTPRSRAGVAPNEKPPEDDGDPMEDLLK